MNRFNFELQVQRSRSWQNQIWSKRHFGNFEGHGFKVTDSCSGRGILINKVKVKVNVDLYNSALS